MTAVQAQDMTISEILQRMVVIAMRWTFIRTAVMAVLAMMKAMIEFIQGHTKGFA